MKCRAGLLCAGRNFWKQAHAYAASDVKARTLNEMKIRYRHRKITRRFPAHMREMTMHRFDYGDAAEHFASADITRRRREDLSKMT